MKKEKSPIVVVLCIIFLFLFIILPPTFRKHIPKEDTSVENMVQDKLQILTCTKTSISEMFQANSKTKYRNGMIETNTIQFEKLIEVPPNYTENSTIQSQVTINNEIEKLSTVNGINMNNTGSITTFVVDSEIIKQYPNDEILNMYFQDIEKQKIFYESLSYTCNILES